MSTTHEPRAVAPPRATTPTEIPIMEGLTLPLHVVQVLIQAEVDPLRFFSTRHVPGEFQRWADAKAYARREFDKRNPEEARRRAAWFGETGEGVA